MKRVEAKHPLAIRWFHWINFPVLMIMMWSGMLIYWADDVLRIGISRFTLIHFFPDWPIRKEMDQSETAYADAEDVVCPINEHSTPHHDHQYREIDPVEPADG